MECSAEARDNGLVNIIRRIGDIERTTVAIKYIYCAGFGIGG